MAKKHSYNNFFTEEKWEQVNILNKAIRDDYLQECKQRQMKDSTIKQYSNDWRIVMIKVMEMFGNKSILELSKKDWRKLSLYFKESCEHSNARVNRLMSATRSMLTYCENDDDDYEEYTQNTASKVKGLGKEVVREIIFFTDEEFHKMYNYCIENKHYQKALAIALAYDSGGRKNELIQVRKHGFYDEKTNATNTVIGKRGKEFQLVYFSKTKEAAKLWLDERGEDDIDLLFTLGTEKREITGEAFYGWFKTLGKLIGKPEMNVHSSRHSCAENLSQAVHSHYALVEVGRPEGLTLEELQLHLNHSDSSTTQSYLKDKSGEQKLSMFGFAVTDNN